MIAFVNHQTIITNAGYPIDRRKARTNSWCAVSLKFLEWQFSTWHENGSFINVYHLPINPSKSSSEGSFRSNESSVVNGSPKVITL